MFEIAATTVNIDFGAILLALAPILAVAANFYFSRKQTQKIAVKSSEEINQNRELVKDNTAKTEEIHTMVNDQRDQMINEITDLKGQIKDLKGQIRTLLQEKENTTSLKERKANGSSD